MEHADIRSPVVHRSSAPRLFRLFVHRPRQKKGRTLCITSTTFTELTKTSISTTTIFTTSMAAMSCSFALRVFRQQAIPTSRRPLSLQCTTWNSRGFNDDELDKLKIFLADNMTSLLAEAQETLGKDEHLVEVSFELTQHELTMLLRAAYLSGISPGEFVNNALKDFIERCKTPEGAAALKSWMQDEEPGNQGESASDDN